MKRRVGIGAIQKQKLEQEKYKDKGSTIQENQLEQLSKHLNTFRDKLESFASEYKNDIKKNAQFRRHFQEMCASIGVDPLASRKGFWSMLGMGDFYYELSVQIVEVCLATNYKNGGLISLDELRTRLIRSRGNSQLHQEITNEDLLAAAKKLKVFGNGFSIIPIGRGQFLVQSVPGELNLDHSQVLQQVAGKNQAYISVTVLENELNWTSERAQRALDFMVQEGYAWFDSQSPVEHLYWFPSLFTECMNADKDNS
uniref:Vacuolar-sorting protein SNF8 n=1 Tax=Cacopsylla melanoneura TaxID=428564 RepID=A0A8D8SS52_9HEMI